MKRIICVILTLGFISTCPDERFCLKCESKDTNSKCLSCENSFFNIDKSGCDQTIEKPLDNCKIYIDNEPTKCQNCEEKFGVDETTNTCKKCTVTNCAICDGSQNNCQACFGQYFLKLSEGKNSECVLDKNKKTENCWVNRASVDQDQPDCVYCANGFTTEKGNCVPEIVQNCREQDPSNKNCLNCKWGYFVTKMGECKANYEGGKLGWLFAAIVLGIVGLGSLVMVLCRCRKNETESLLG